jgi:ribosomal protein L32
MKKLLTLMEANRPTKCAEAECEGVMVFRGLGSYKCEKCGVIDYDDYGHARDYIEKHPGANVAEISDKTGVSRKAINNMVKDGRFEIAKDSRTFLRCEMCGTEIRGGRVCKNCEAAYHKQYEDDVRRKAGITGGFGKAERSEDAEGSKRFKRQL